jgi:hypothetical protein
VHLERHFVLAVGAFLRGRFLDPVVVEADLLEQVGDQSLLVGAGLGADEIEEFQRRR